MCIRDRDETEAPDGYLNEGKLSQEFDIQENGKIIDLTSKEHAILNQIIRGDLEFVKVSDGDLNRLANVPFSITSKTTGESHTIVTDKNGYASTSAEWNKHTANTNRGETSEDGIWFGTSKPDDSKGALKMCIRDSTYTVQYAGDAYFADHVFHLTDEQKKLAQDYAENLTTFFGNAASGVAMAINLSDEVLSYRPAVERIAAKYGMSEYVELILAVMMQESGGRGLDVMQAAEGSFNTKYPHKPNGITDPEYSIECGIQELKYALEKAGCTGPTDLDRIKLALHGYNYGSGYIDWAMERDGGYTKENAIAYSDMMCARRCV